VEGSQRVLTTNLLPGICFGARKNFSCYLGFEWLVFEHLPGDLEGFNKNLQVCELIIKEAVHGEGIEPTMIKLEITRVDSWRREGVLT
jgi:hypothetical protein